MPKEAEFNYTDFKDAPSNDNILSRINAAAIECKEAELEVAELEEKLKEAKEKYRNLTESVLPGLMEEAEQVKLVTKNGTQVELKEAIQAYISKANEKEAFAYLEANGHGAIVKRQFIIEFGKDEEEQVKEFQKLITEQAPNLPMTTKAAVHPATLKSWVKEQLEEGEEIPLATFGVHRQNIVKVK